MKEPIDRMDYLISLAHCRKALCMSGTWCGQKWFMITEKSKPGRYQINYHLPGYMQVHNGKSTFDALNFDSSLN